jgi:hypothetical protein
MSTASGLWFEIQLHPGVFSLPAGHAEEDAAARRAAYFLAAALSTRIARVLKRKNP